MLAVAAWSAAVLVAAAGARPMTPIAAQASEERVARGRALTAAKCTACHGLSKVATAGRSAEAWQATVDEMIRLGAEVSEGEAAAIDVGERPWGVVVSADGTRAYTANGPSGDVSIVDVAGRAVIARVATGDRPWGLALVK